MPDFSLILPVHMALAVTEDRGTDAVHRLSLVAQFTPRSLLSTTDTVWSGTGIAMRHALLLQWLANEARS